MDGVRAGHIAALLGSGKVLVAGGFAGGEAGPAGPDTLASAELFDLITGSWSAAGEMLVGRAQPTAALLGSGKVLVAGGSGGQNRLATAELYDPSSDSWTATANMLEAHIGHTATLLRDGKVLLVGGTDGLDPMPSTELYQPGSGS
jgi:N-acetylneuraminic acid mutarotase